ncbi:MAG: hypothetical protein H6662_06080 [Ardenticatenaceae bacterium]|nr:hypothetical protein [Anaerolineales bacterium]MCB8921134.1 hypothetical protein [Ardenticatenaceae bacterium]MCB8990839.1 hypothetical protein [Ardenticatenaceae bacterium]MCB9004467.1 hypothetical protein [Ardenticatenaceae bacterium]
MSDTTSSQQDKTPKPRRGRRIIGGLLVAISLLLAVYLLVAYLGWQSGQQLLVERQQTELSDQIARQIELAQQNIGQGSYNLATRRLEWVLERNPSHAEAQALLQQAREALNLVLTPQVVEATAVPTATPLPSPTPGVISDPEQELQRIQQLMDNEAWEDAVTALRAFLSQFPNYERQETNQLLYDAYLNLGFSLVDGEQAELGLYYFAQAETLGDLPQEAEDYRLWADWFLQGMGYYGVNWGVAVDYFRDLCLVAPFYQSSCDLLHEALIALGDQYAAAADWCPAQELYAEANRQERSVELSDKLETAVTNCQSATPTPETITNTLPVTNSQQFIGPPVRVGTPTPTFP